jgi:hypothetical protein
MGWFPQLTLVQLGLQGPVLHGYFKINHTNTAIEIAYKYAEENKTEEVKLSKEFKQHIALFSNKEASKFPPSCK